MEKSFTKEDLKELAAGNPVEGLEVVSDTLTGRTRWSVIYTLVFRDLTDNKYYQINYSTGATELQDERPFDNDQNTIQCHRVQPMQELVTVYKSIK